MTEYSDLAYNLLYDYLKLIVDTQIPYTIIKGGHYMKSFEELVNERDEAVSRFEELVDEIDKMESQIDEIRSEINKIRSQTAKIRSEIDKMICNFYKNYREQNPNSSRNSTICYIVNYLELDQDEVEQALINNGIYS